VPEVIMITAHRSDTFLDQMRGVTDPLADTVVASLFAEGEVARVNAVMKQLMENDDPVPRGLPAVVCDYLVATEALPTWSDAEAIIQGERVFMDHGLHIVGALFCSSLPECYAGAKGAQVLAMTARLMRRPYRRIIETAQFVVDVMSPGGLAQGGAGIRSAQKVRLVHAGVRWLCQTGGHWDPAWGKPINQEDLAGTLMTFSTVVLDALQRFGIEVAPAQQEAYHHVWRNVGHLLGIQPALVPENVADGRELMTVIRRRQHASSGAGKELTAALLEFMEQRIPRLPVDPVPAHLVRYLVGDEVADLLGVPRMNAVDRGVLAIAAAVERVVDLPLRHWQRLDRLVGGFNRRLLEGLLAVTRDDGRPPFRIPSSLRSSWGLRAA
jgi:ER-bound oxygenase mpaB/B'/Rubber oxygenase, catalytic domain